MTIALADEVLRLAVSAGATVTTAESCTGGMVAAAITDIAGSSSAFERGFVTYSNQAKIEMLGVSPATLDAYGAVSENVARERASTMKSLATALTAGRCSPTACKRRQWTAP